MTHDANGEAYIASWAASHNWTCGGPGGDVLDPNNFACGMSFAAQYELSPANYKLALLVSLQQAIAQSPLYSWWWVDTFFMSFGTWYGYGRILADTALWDFAYAQYNSTAYGGPLGASQPGLWSSEHSLFFRDHTFINQTEPNGAPVFWARGNGWAAASFVQALEQLPAAHPYAIEYQGKIRAMAASLKAAQGADGLWRSSLLDPAHFPTPETTGSSCFTYMLAYAINAGLIDAATYLPVVEAAWTGLATISLQPGGLVGWCQPAAGSPGPATQNSTSDFCVGQFLLAASQVWVLAGGSA